MREAGSDDIGTTSREGYLPFRDWQTWYLVIDGGLTSAGGKRPPLLVLHGGPGIPHDYLDPLAELAHDGRDVVFYDQVGCGESTRPHDPSVWSVDLFVEELENVRRGLGLERVHILGQSWGGMLALDYAVRRPQGVAGLVLADTAPSMEQWVAESARLRAELPDDVRTTLEEHEAAGTIESPEYQAAMMAFYAEHVCRADPWPEYVERAFSALEEDSEVYNTMWGPNEFTCTGSLKTWDVRDRLADIDIPTLVVCGRHDEATPAIAQTLVDGIPGAESHIFEDSSHLPHAEEPDAYRAVIEEFLARVDAGG
ncbi:MAG: proline iminopeptidase-family hydrolase [Actinobacteria bacterium]|nr:proline iminopeptidase-family hydrolase [Actinomycetota bacterium]